MKESGKTHLSPNKTQMSVGIFRNVCSSRNSEGSPPSTTRTSRKTARKSCTNLHRSSTLSDAHQGQEFRTTKTAQAINWGTAIYQTSQRDSHNLTHRTMFDQLKCPENTWQRSKPLLCSSSFQYGQPKLVPTVCSPGR